MMTYRVSGLDWCVIDTRRILAGPFPTLKAALGEVERRTTRTWVPGAGKSGHFAVTVDETPAKEWEVPDGE